MRVLTEVRALAHTHASRAWSPVHVCTAQRRDCEAAARKSSCETHRNPKPPFVARLPPALCAPSITHHTHVCPITLHHATHSPLPACDPPIPNSSPLRRSASCEGDRRRALASQEAPAFHRARAGLDQPCRKLQEHRRDLALTTPTDRAWLTASNAPWASRGATTHQ